MINKSSTKISRPAAWLGFYLITLALSGCASTAPTVDEEVRVPSRPIDTKSEIVERSEVFVENIDLLGLQRSLGLAGNKTELGLREKSFDTCRAGFGYSASRNCRRAYFSDLKFQILCRDTDGTVSEAVGASQLRPLSGRSVLWTLPQQSGTVVLDGEGYGQIAVVGPSSRRSQRLKLLADNDFVTLPAGEVRRIVTPKNWCNAN